MATAIVLVMPRALVVRVESVRDLRRFREIRVAVELDGLACPMRVAVPLAGPAPTAGALVEFTGCRVEFHNVGGRCRPVVRADGVKEVRADVRAA